MLDKSKSNQQKCFLGTPGIFTTSHESTVSNEKRVWIKQREQIVYLKVVRRHGTKQSCLPVYTYIIVRVSIVRAYCIVD